jgi:UDP-N-acetylmuramoyl-tripeptide--D-alanyl-D-alanine ligase
LLTSTPAEGRHILAAGEMLELGPTSADLHHEAGRAAVAAATRKLDWIIGVEGDAEVFVRGAVEAGHPAAQARFFASSAEAGEFVGNLLQRGDVVLVKGSRGVKMERIVEALDSRFARASGRPAVSAPSDAPKERS